MMRNLIKKILKEEESSDFQWIKDIEPLQPGAGFNIEDICFDDDNCVINITDDYLIFTMDYDRWRDDFAEDLFDEDEWYVKEFMYNDEYEGYDDYHELDTDEINYIGRTISDENITRLNSILAQIAPNVDLAGAIDGDEFLDILPPYDTSNKTKHVHIIAPLWDDFVNESLNALSTTIQRNRWVSLGNTYRSRTLEGHNHLNTPIYFSLYSDDITISVPMKLVHKIHNSGNNDLSDILRGVSEVLGSGWQDWYYEHWDTTGSGEDINWYMSRFLDSVSEIIENKGLLENSEEFSDLMVNFGFTFRHSINKLIKSNQDGTMWTVDNVDYTDRIIRLSLGRGFFNPPIRTITINWDSIGEEIDMSNWKNQPGQKN